MSTGAAAAFVTDGAARPRAGRIVAVLVFAGLASAPLAAPFGAEGYVLSILTRLMIFALAALSLDLILGYGGLISFGHAAFLGIGAYAVGILTSHGVGDVLVHLATALAVSALVALVVGALVAAHAGRLFHHDHPRLRADAVLPRDLARRLWRRRRPDAAVAQPRLRPRSPRQRSRVLLRRVRVPAPRLPPLPGGRRLAVRAGAARQPREPGAHAGARLQPARLPAHRLRRRRDAVRRRRVPAGEPHRVRQPRLS